MAAQGLGPTIRIVGGGQTQLDGSARRGPCWPKGPCRPPWSAYNDDTAVAAMGLLAQQGIEVPGQLSIIGWDDGEAAALSPVGLTSVVQQPDAMARLAVERIVARMERRKIEDREIVLEPELSVRVEHRQSAIDNVLTILRTRSNVSSTAN